MENMTENTYPKADIISDPIADEEFEPLTAAETGGEEAVVKGRTYLQDAWSRFQNNKLALVSLVFLVIMILLAVFVPIVSPYSYDEMNMTKINQLPNALHLLGTDKFGRDILVRIMYGARISLSVGFVAALLNLVIGVTYGGICGHFGGKVDLILMRIVDIIYSVPILLYVILAMLIFGSSLVSVMVAIGISSWVGVARLVRGQILSLKEQEYVQAAYVIGASRMRIIVKHLLVNCLGPIIVDTTLIIPTAIFNEAFLAFVGIGISLPQASWGTMANEARSLFQTQPLQMLWPILAISLTILSLNFIGDGLSEALDPRTR